MNKYVSSENGTAPITCNRAAIGGAWEVFDWVVNADGKISLRGSNNAYVSSENGTQSMTCNRPSIGGWEAFSWGVVGTSAASIAPPDIQEEVSVNGDFDVYPNPVDGKVLHLDLVKKGAKTITIFDNDGRIVYQRNTSDESVDLMPADLKAGYYHVQIENENGKSIKRVIVK
jgi:hypothetical protein